MHRSQSNWIITVLTYSSRSSRMTPNLKVYREKTKTGYVYHAVLKKNCMKMDVYYKYLFP